LLDDILIDAVFGHTIIMACHIFGSSVEGFLGRIRARMEMDRMGDAGIHLDIFGCGRSAAVVAEGTRVFRS